MALSLNFDPFPVLHSDRLVLRQLEETDVQALFAIRSNPGVAQYLDRPLAQSNPEVLEFIQKINRQVKEHEAIFWAIELKEQEGLVGSICFWNIDEQKCSAETGYELHPEYQGQGIMKEALAIVLPFGFEIMHLQLIEAFVHPQNQSSLALLQKFQFERSAVQPEDAVVLYELLRSK